MNSKALLIQESGKYPDQSGSIMTAPSGRKFYRHSSGMGSVMIYNEIGVEKRMLVLDAAYRASGLKWDSASNNRLPTFGNIPNGAAGYFGGSQANTTGNQTISDAQLDAFFKDAGDTGTARSNTNILAAISTAAAALHCRKKLVNGIGCDLPIAQQLARIYCDDVFIDSIDPTGAANSSLRLVNGISQSWSSTTPGQPMAWAVSHSYCMYQTQTMGKGVVPVLELSN